MKSFCIGLLSICIAAPCGYAQNTVKMSAVKSNDYGVSYTLPKTIIVLRADAVKTTRKAGEFYEYAERYLNITNPITEDGVSYSIAAIKAGTEGIPNKENSYLVEFKSGTTAPYVTLSKDGLICAINADSDYAPNRDKAATVSGNKEALPSPNRFLSEEILRAGSKAKQAELIAKQIFKLRETKSNILTGEADNMPPDGAAYKLVMEQIDEQEKALVSMFAGSETTENLSKDFEVAIPVNKNIDNLIVFRFSKKLGFVDSNDLSGAPVKLSLISREAFKEMPFMTPKEQKDWEKKFSQGIIYNIPAKADLTVAYAGKNWVSKECDVVQYGTQEVLAPKMFDNNKEPIKVIFFPDLGAIKQIVQ